jgi:DNA-directed RNA polymerase subunit beta'
MKTADAGYLTRRLVDVSHDVIITQEDCGTLRGLVCTALKNGDEIISSLYERILGRVSVHDIIHPTTGELIVKSGEEITEAKAKIIDESPIRIIFVNVIFINWSSNSFQFYKFSNTILRNRNLIYSAICNGWKQQD